MARRDGMDKLFVCVVTNGAGHEADGAAESLSLDAASVGVGGNDFATADRPQGTPILPVDRVLDRVHAAVGKEGVDDARMVTPGGDGGVGWATVVLILGAHVAIQSRCPGRGLGVRG